MENLSPYNEGYHILDVETKVKESVWINTNRTLKILVENM